MTIWFNDTFTEGATTDLTSHTSDSGHSWILAFASSGAVSPPKVFTSVGGIAGDGEGHHIARASVIAPAENVVISATTYYDSLTHNGLGLAARLNSNASIGYVAILLPSSEWVIGRISAPVDLVTRSVTALGSPVPASYSAGNTPSLEFEVTGSGDTVTLKLRVNGTEIINVTDTSADRVTSAGYPGLWLNGTVPGNGLFFNTMSAADVAGGGGGNTAPTFPGPNIADINATQNVAIASDTVSDSFSDGDALTFSAIGTWPAGVVVTSAGVIQGTPTAAGTFANLKVRATDTASQTVDSNAFTITVSSPGVLTGANCSQANSSSTGAITVMSLVTLTSTVMKSFFTKLVRENETDIDIFVYDTTGGDSGDLATKLSGQSNNGSGIWTGQIAGTAGRAYRLIYKFSDGSEGMETVIAA